MSTEIRHIDIAHDSYLHLRLRGCYAPVVNDPSVKHVFLRLDWRPWISAAGLNMMMTFVAAIHAARPDIAVYVELIDETTLGQLDREGGIADEDRTRLQQTLRFYESIELLKSLYEVDVVEKPKRSAITELTSRLHAQKADCGYLYSSRMLSLSPLIETSEEQYALTRRVRTLTSMLSANLFRRVEREDIDTVSSNLMFEIVKNIYQHSGLPDEYRARPRGYACAQIMKHGIIRIKELEDVMLRAALEQVKPGIRGKEWQWMSISINDFGVGVCNSVRDFLRRLRPAKLVQIGSRTFNLDDLDNLADEELIQIAVATQFSRKEFRQDIDTWEAGDQLVRLAGRGRGLLYCLGFLVRVFGRLRIRSGGVEMDVCPTASQFMRRSEWVNIEDIEKHLEERGLSSFHTVCRRLDNEERKFPGTQILVEIPVEVFRK
jgi:hypothetical protein